MNWKAILSTLVLGAALSGPCAVQAAGDQMNDPENLIDFSESSKVRWQVVNDGVMGGVSRSTIKPTDHRTGLFFGELSLENNGGFASVRALIDPRDLSAFNGLEIRVRGDGRTYQLRLRTDGQYDGVAYRREFDTTPDEWTVVRLPFTGFEPTFRGRLVAGAPPLDLKRIAQVAFMLADKRAGEFQLEIEHVRPWKNPVAEPDGE